MAELVDDRPQLAAPTHLLDHPHPPHRSLPPAAVPAAAALATLAVCLVGIGKPVLWRDEVATWSAAHRSVSGLFALLGHVDASSGAYYLALHAWTILAGDTPAALRLPSALAMAATAAVVAALARREFGSGAGIGAGSVFAGLPAVSRYGQEARAYAFVCLFAVLATYLLVHALDRPDRKPRWAAYAFAVTALGVAHLVALTLLAGHALRARAHARRFTVTLTAALLPLTPLAVVAYGERHRQIDWIVTPHADALRTLLPQVAASGPAALLLVLLALGATNGPGRRAAAHLWLEALLPVAVLWTVSHVADTAYFLPRYLLFTLPAWAVLAGAGLARVPRSRTPLAAVLVVATAAACIPDQRALRQNGAHESLRTYPTGTPGPWIDYRGAARVIREGLRPGDGVVYAGAAGQQRVWHVDVGINYYLRDSPRPRDVLLDTSSAAGDELWPLDCPDVVACLDRTHPPRIWLVAVSLDGRAAGTYSGLASTETRVIEAHYHVVSAAELSGTTVSLLLPGATAAAPRQAVPPPRPRPRPAGPAWLN